MILEKTLRNAIADLPAAPGRQTLSVAHNDWDVRATIEHHDAVGCLLWDMRLHRATPLGGTQQAWAERLAPRVTGLLETLKVHEIDAGRGLALLRSTSPTSRGDARQYYEVELHGTNALHLRRYQGYAEPGRPREQIAFSLTHESLAKLLEDLA